MNADFWMGSFIGTMLALGLILLVVGLANKNATKGTDSAVKSNERAHDLLEERNEIDREKNIILGSIATALEQTGKPTDPEIITCVNDLILAAHRKESVIPITPWGGFPKPRAAAFVINMNATMVNSMITRGLRIHRKEEAK